MDARKALKMFEKVHIHVLGLVENMAVHVCSQCGHAEHVFGSGGGERMAAQYGVPLLGSLPLELAIREQGDIGVPLVALAEVDFPAYPADQLPPDLDDTSCASASTTGAAAIARRRWTRSSPARATTRWPSPSR